MRHRFISRNTRRQHDLINELKYWLGVIGLGFLFGLIFIGILALYCLRVGPIF